MVRGNNGTHLGIGECPGATSSESVGRKRKSPTLFASVGLFESESDYLRIRNTFSASGLLSSFAAGVPD